MQGQIGVVAPGAYADLMAVRADPLSDVSRLSDVVFVMKDGKTFRNAVSAPR
jgi:imidazolonepropionase-like amidohydrolase